MADEEKDDAPLKDKKKGLSLPIMIAIIAGSVVLLFVAIIFVIRIMMSNLEESIISSTGKEPTVKVVKKEKKDESLDTFDYMETGRITTNPLSSSQFVVVNLGIFYKAITKGNHEEEAKEETAADPEAKAKRLNALVKHQINSQIGGMDVFALQVPRDSLMTIFREKLNPAFKMEGFQLKDVILIEFIIQ